MSVALIVIVGLVVVVLIAVVVVISLGVVRLAAQADAVAEWTFRRLVENEARKRRIEEQDEAPRQREASGGTMD